MRYLLLLLLVVIANCSASNHNHFSVLLSSIEEIKRGTVFSIASDTVIKEALNHSLFLKDHTTKRKIETHIFKNVSLTLTINKNKSIHLDPETTKINLTHAIENLKEHGCNELLIQFNSSYTLHPKKDLSDAHLLTTSVSKHYHLYLFTSPVIAKNNDFIYCYLNDTGAREYGTWLVKFTLEISQGNSVSVGVCVKDSTAQDSHNRTEIYYDATQDACVFRVPDPVPQSDVGSYTCSLHVTHVEIGSKTTHCRGNVSLKVSPSRSEPLAIILPVGITALLVVLGLLIIVAIVRRYATKEPRPEPIDPPPPAPIIPVDPPLPIALPDSDTSGYSGDESTADHGHLLRSGAYHYIKRRPKLKIDTVPDTTESDQSQPRSQNSKGKVAAAESSYADDESSLMFPRHKRSFRRESSRRKKKKTADKKQASSFGE